MSDGDPVPVDPAPPAEPVRTPAPRDAEWAAAAPPATSPGDIASPPGETLRDVGAPSAFAPVPAASPPAALLAVTADGARLVPAPHPDRRTADGYLRMTARILLETQRHGFRSIGVMSAHEGEGRTAAAVNLAVCLGRAQGRTGRVLLVDADARHRGLSTLFCGPGVPGGERHPMLIGTALESVDLLTAPVLDDGLTVSSPDAWVSRLEELGAVYPHIVVDCPAVLENPEGMVLRECVQQIVLVARAGRSTRSALQRALGTTATRVLGVILNGTETSASGEAWR